DSRRARDVARSMTEMSHKRRLQALLNNYGMTTDDAAVEMIHGDASKVIHQFSDSLNADLIIMGTVGRTGVPGLFIGNTAEDVLQTAKASILAVKPPSFVSPVK
ncbi:MAG: universal stress protein, partial [Candidatus Thiodiazotropha lotti]